MYKQILTCAIFFFLLGPSCRPGAASVLNSAQKTPAPAVGYNTPPTPRRSPSATNDVHAELRSSFPTPPKVQPTPEVWQPQPGLSWQIDLSSEHPALLSGVQVYEVDLYTEQAFLDRANSSGAKLICYISAGSWEAWRPDAGQFPPEVLGKEYAGWPGERRLDIRQIDQLAPIMQARLDLCAARGFDAVDPDNIEVSSNDSGFPITSEEERRYALWLAEQAHQRRLAIGMKNAVHLVNELLPNFEFIIAEDCFAQGWCEQTLSFIENNKAVFAVEYTDLWTIEQFRAQVCPRATAWNLSAILKQRSLNSWRIECPTRQ